MAERDDIIGLFPEKVTIAAGVTCLITEIPGQNSVQIKYDAGGTLSIIGASMSGGCTFAVSNLYTFGTSEILQMDSSGPVYLIAGGATTTFYLLRGRCGFRP